MIDPVKRGLAAFALVAFAFVSSADAQERVLTSEKATGFLGVVTQCVSFVRIDFANGMCDALAERVSALAAENGLAHVDLGRVEWGFGTDTYLAPPDSADIDAHVWLTFYIRAAVNPTGTFVWASLYEPIGNAEEDGTVRPGRLVLWEDSGLGIGDAETIANALTAGIGAKLEPVFKTLGAHMAR